MTTITDRLGEIRSTIGGTAVAEQLLDAVEAVVALHRPMRFHDDADRCGHTNNEHTIVHSHDGDPLCEQTFTMADPPQCEECGDVYGEDNDWPCPTIRALNAALGVSDE